MAELSEIVQDPEFGDLSSTEQFSVISAFDPSFNDLSDEEKTTALSRITGITPTESAGQQAGPTRVQAVEQSKEPALEFLRQQDTIARQPIEEVPFDVRKRGAGIIRPVVETAVSQVGRGVGGAVGGVLGGTAGAIKGAISGDIAGFAVGRQLADKADSILRVENPTRQGGLAEEVITDSVEGAILLYIGDLTLKGLSAFGRKALKKSVREIGNELSAVKESANRLGIQLLPSEELGTFVSRDIEKIFANFVTSAGELDKIQLPRIQKIAQSVKAEIEKVQGGKDVVRLNNLMADLKKETQRFIGRRLKTKGANLNALSDKFIKQTLKLPEMDFFELGTVTAERIQDRFNIGRGLVNKAYGKATGLLPQGEDTIVKGTKTQEIMQELQTKGFDVDRLIKLLSDNRVASAVPTQVTPEAFQAALQKTGSPESALESLSGLEFTFGTLKDMKTKAGQLGWGRKPVGTEFLGDINTRDVRKLYNAIVDDMSNVKLSSGDAVDASFQDALTDATALAKSHIDMFAGNKVITSLLKKNPDDAFGYMTGVQSKKHIIRQIRASGGQNVIDLVRDKSIREIFGETRLLQSSALRGTSGDTLVDAFSPTRAIQKASSLGDDNLREIMGNSQFRKMKKFLQDSLKGERSSVGDEFARTLLLESPEVMVNRIANDPKLAKFAVQVYKRNPEKLAGIVLEKAITGSDELGTVIYDPELLSKRLSNVNPEALKQLLPKETIQFIDDMARVARKASATETALKRGGTPGAVSTLFLLRTAVRTPGIFSKLLASPKYAARLYFSPTGRKILEEGVFKALYNPAKKLSEQDLTRLFIKGMTIFADEMLKEDFKRDTVGPTLLQDATTTLP